MGCQRRRPRAGADLEQPIDVSLEESYRGTTRTIGIATPEGQTRRIEVTIPPGVDNGSRVRIAGQGQHGLNGGAAGDLYLVLAVRPDPRFERRGDLHAEVHVRLPEQLSPGQCELVEQLARTEAGAADGVGTR